MIKSVRGDAYSIPDDAGPRCFGVSPEPLLKQHLDVASGSSRRDGVLGLSRGDISLKLVSCARQAFTRAVHQ
jgi:hypothetical protein